MTRIAYVVTTPLTARTLLRGQLRYMRSIGYDVTLIADAGEELDQVGRSEGVEVAGVRMSRNMSPVEDVRSLVELCLTLRKLQPHVVNAGTMKAGLLGMMAAFVARVPVRVYVLRGLRLEGLTGLSRAVLTFCEFVASGCAHRVICVSPSLRREYERLGVTRASKLRVLLAGSSNGIDTARYEPTAERLAAAASRRSQLGIPADAKVVGFVGRITHDKGIEDLLRAFESVRKRVPRAFLLLVGGFDDTDPVSVDCKQAVQNGESIALTGFVDDVAVFYPLMDVLVLPSFREGFPNVPLEAAISSVPTVAYAATGTVDAVADGHTGTIVPKLDWRALGDAVARYLTDDALRAAHGSSARERALELFRNDAIWSALAAQYEELLAAHLGMSATSFPSPGR
ncbi:MAG: glycosyltransferase family 4 protein [Polyangiaceae bacterium]|nr:glycosyltransferase family 4 protein [Polyangiaceae bacterium]